MKELRSKEEIIKVNQNISNNAQKVAVQSVNVSSSNPVEAFKEIEDRYTERMAYMSNQISKLESVLG
jgi:phage shock protein A